MSNSNFQIKTNRIPPSLLPQGKALKVALWVLGVIVVAIVATMFLSHNISDVAKKQLRAIKSGNITKAYEMTTDAFQQQTSLDAFNKFVEKYPILKQYKSVSFTDKKVENDVGYLKGIIEGADNSKMQVEYQLVKDDGKWKIQAMRLSAADVMKTSTDIAENTSTIHAILISDQADPDGYVQVKKSVIPASAPKIYATVQIIAPDPGAEVSATLVYSSSGSKIGPSTSVISKSGNVMKAFSFSRVQSVWPKGGYQVDVVLSNGAKQSVKFKVK